MSTLHLCFQGMFQIWSYSVGHGQLLLRSTKSPDRPTQIDILFTDVAAICIPTTFDGVEVHEVDAADLRTQPVLGNLSWCDRRVYAIAGPGVDGYVVAGAVAFDEGDREYDSVSPLFDGRGGSENKGQGTFSEKMG